MLPLSLICLNTTVSAVYGITPPVRTIIFVILITPDFFFMMEDPRHFENENFEKQFKILHTQLFIVLHNQYFELILSFCNILYCIRV